jgi:hypothetical protein
VIERQIGQPRGPAFVQVPFVFTVKNAFDSVFIKQIAQVDEGSRGTTVIAMSGYNFQHQMEVRGIFIGGRSCFGSQLN